MQPLGLLVLRLALGAVMITHGYQKVFGGMQHFQQVLHGLGIPTWMAYLAAAAEFGGGILVVVGFLTRFAAFAILIDMLGVGLMLGHLPGGSEPVRRPSRSKNSSSAAMQALSR